MELLASPDATSPQYRAVVTHSGCPTAGRCRWEQSPGLTWGSGIKILSRAWIHWSLPTAHPTWPGKITLSLLSPTDVLILMSYFQLKWTVRVTLEREGSQKGVAEGPGRRRLGRMYRWGSFQDQLAGPLLTTPTTSQGTALLSKHQELGWLLGTTGPSWGPAYCHSHLAVDGNACARRRLLLRETCKAYLWEASYVAFGESPALD